MIRSILVGLDGSSFSVAAQEQGIAWAKRHDALLVGLAVVDAPDITQSGLVPLGGDAFKQQRDEVLLAKARTQVEQVLERFSLRCSEAQVPFKVLEDVGAPAVQIALEAQRYDLILLGQQTRFRFPTTDAPCDTLHEVLKNTPRPLVAVPEKLPAGNAVMIAYDGSLQAARTLQMFVEAGLAGADPVHVVTVAPEGKDASRPADRALDFLHFHDVQGQRHVLHDKHVAETLLDHAGQLQARLLVMGAYGKSALHEFFLGSVTKTVLKKGTIPLFLYH